MDGDPVESVIDDNGNVRRSVVPRVIERLHERALLDRDCFSPPTNPPDEDRALKYLREGAGYPVAIYTQLRTGGRLYEFSETEFRSLEAAMNVWFELYAACYGVSIEPAVPLRTAAEALVDTEDIAAVAEIVTGVP